MKRIDDLISSVFSKFELGEYQKRRRALDSWESVAGQPLADLTRARGFDRSVAVIEVLHPAASMEIRLHMKELVASLNDLAGDTVFTRIRTITAGRGISGRHTKFDR